MCEAKKAAHAPVSVRVWAVFGGAGLALVLHAALQSTWTCPAGLARAAVVGALLVAATETDLRTGRIPNRLVVAAGVIGGGLLAMAPTLEPAKALLGALVAAGITLGVRALGRVAFGWAGMGMGDVKLASALGLLIGPDVVWTLYLAIVLGGAVAALMLLMRGRTPGATLPFAPFVAAGALLGVYVMPFRVVLGWLM